MLEYLLSFFTSPEHRPINITLFNAIRANNYPLFSQLLQNGHKATTANHVFSEIHAAAQQADHRFVDDLLTYGDANVNALTRNGFTPLDIANSSGNHHTAIALTAFGATNARVTQTPAIFIPANTPFQPNWEMAN